MCDPVLSQFGTPLARKRKAKDTELELTGENNDQEGQSEVVNIRVVDGSRRPRLSSKSMWRYLKNSVRTMRNSLKGFLSNVGARISGTAYEAVETRRHDE